jgi:hypothetical protein
MDQPPSDYLTRIRLLEQYASAIAGLVRDEVNFICLMVPSFFAFPMFYFTLTQPWEMVITH